MPLDSLARLEQRLYRRSEFWPSLGQLRGAHGKHMPRALPCDLPGGKLAHAVGALQNPSK